MDYYVYNSSITQKKKWRISDDLGLRSRVIPKPLSPKKVIPLARSTRQKEGPQNNISPLPYPEFQDLTREANLKKRRSLLPMNSPIRPVAHLLV